MVSGVFLEGICELCNDYNVTPKYLMGLHNRLKDKGVNDEKYILLVIERFCMIHKNLRSNSDYWTLERELSFSKNKYSKDYKFKR